jgi:hypothetical protein
LLQCNELTAEKQCKVLGLLENPALLHPLMYFARELRTIHIASQRALSPKDDHNLYKNPNLGAWLVFKEKLVIDTGLL